MRDRLIRFYSFYNPSCVGTVDAILANYAGREEELMRVLTTKYGPEPPESQQPQQGGGEEGLQQQQQNFHPSSSSLSDASAAAASHGNASERRAPTESVQSQFEVVHRDDDPYHRDLQQIQRVADAQQQQARGRHDTTDAAAAPFAFAAAHNSSNAASHASMTALSSASAPPNASSSTANKPPPQNALVSSRQRLENLILEMQSQSPSSASSNNKAAPAQQAGTSNGGGGVGGGVSRTLLEDLAVASPRPIPTPNAAAAAAPMPSAAFASSSQSSFENAERLKMLAASTAVGGSSNLLPLSSSSHQHNTANKSLNTHVNVSSNSLNTNITSNSSRVRSCEAARARVKARLLAFYSLHNTAMLPFVEDVMLSSGIPLLATIQQQEDEELRHGGGGANNNCFTADVIESIGEGLVRELQRTVNSKNNATIDVISNPHTAAVSVKQPANASTSSNNEAAFAVAANGNSHYGGALLQKTASSASLHSTQSVHSTANNYNYNGNTAHAPAAVGSSSAAGGGGGGGLRSPSSGRPAMTTASTVATAGPSGGDWNSRGGERGNTSNTARQPATVRRGGEGEEGGFDGLVALPPRSISPDHREKTGPSWARQPQQASGGRGLVGFGDGAVSSTDHHANALTSNQFAHKSNSSNSTGSVRGVSSAPPPPTRPHQTPNSRQSSRSGSPLRIVNSGRPQEGGGGGGGAREAKIHTSYSQQASNNYKSYIPQPFSSSAPPPNNTFSSTPSLSPSATVYLHKQAAEQVATLEGKVSQREEIIAQLTAELQRKVDELEAVRAVKEPPTSAAAAPLQPPPQQQHATREGSSYAALLKGGGGLILRQQPTSPSPASAAKFTAQLKEKDSEMEKLLALLSDAEQGHKQQCEAYEALVKKLQAKLAGTEKQLATVDERYQQMAKERASAQDKQITKLQCEVERLQSALSVSEHHLRMSRMRCGYLTEESEAKDVRIAAMAGERQSLEQQLNALLTEVSSLRLQLGGGVNTSDADIAVRVQFNALVEEIQQQFAHHYEQRLQLTENETQEYYAYAKKQISNRDAMISELTAAIEKDAKEAAEAAAKKLIETFPESKRRLAEEVSRLQNALAMQRSEHYAALTEAMASRAEADAELRRIKARQIGEAVQSSTSPAREVVGEQLFVQQHLRLQQQQQQQSMNHQWNGDGNSHNNTAINASRASENTFLTSPDPRRSGELHKEDARNSNFTTTPKTMSGDELHADANHNDNGIGSKWIETAPPSLRSSQPRNGGNGTSTSHEFQYQQQPQQHRSAIDNEGNTFDPSLRRDTNPPSMVEPNEQQHHQHQQQYGFAGGDAADYDSNGYDANNTFDNFNANNAVSYNRPFASTSARTNGRVSRTASGSGAWGQMLVHRVPSSSPQPMDPQQPQPPFQAREGSGGGGGYANQQHVKKMAELIHNSAAHSSAVAGGPYSSFPHQRR